MAKRAVLKVDGELEQGLQVTLELGEVGRVPFLEEVGSLPPTPELVASLDRWRQIYRQAAQSTRINLHKITVQTGALSQLENCRRAAKALEHQFKSWIESASFHRIDRQLREALHIDEEVQVLLRCRDRRLHSLPWHTWDFFERYPLAELALSAAPGRIHLNSSRQMSAVNVLAVLGDRQGIDTETDRQFLAQLPHANVTFSVEPSRQDVTDQLWEHPWDIVFFAGHSQTEGDQGRIYLNSEDSLTLEELKYGLRTAIAHGLQLAIFNSCDGLGLAYELEQLQIPQLIVMREPIPDRVAQQFLKHFLTAFAHNEPLYHAVRQARERLQGLEGQYPCATWLPMLHQNPTAISPTWRSLQGYGETESAAPREPNVPNSALRIHQQPALKAQNKMSRLRALPLMLLTGLAMTGVILSIRYLGFLQAFELAAFDRLLQLRPNELPDSRLLVILVTDEDVQRQPQNERRGSLSDRTLLQLLRRLQTYQPRVIGLDIYRDFAVQPNHPDLVKQLQQNDRLVTVCKVGDEERQQNGIAPPPEVPTDRVAFSDLVLDADNIVRRHLLAMTPAPSSRCIAPYALSVQLALRYLDAEQISLQYPNPDTWQLGKLRFQPLKGRLGGYQKVDDRGYQILLNYRSFHSPDVGIQKVTLGQVLSGNVDRTMIQDRVVLIGTIAEGTNDSWLTPYSTPQGNRLAIPGVMLQSQMTSQLLSAVLDGRPLLTAWTFWLEGLWVLGWAILGNILAWMIRHRLYWGLSLVIAIAVLTGACLWLLINSGIWVPLLPSAFALVSSGVSYRALAQKNDKSQIIGL